MLKQLGTLVAIVSAGFLAMHTFNETSYYHKTDGKVLESRVNAFEKNISDKLDILIERGR